MNTFFAVALALCAVPASCARIRAAQSLTLDASAGVKRSSALVGKTLNKRYRLLRLLHSDEDRRADPREVGTFPWGHVKDSPLRKEEFQAPVELGKGSFGDTWKALDMHLDPPVPVAVKIFYEQKEYVTKDDLGKNEKLKKEVAENEHECKLVQDMLTETSQHPEGKDNICRCLESHAMDQVADDDVSFLVLELCGTDLEKKLRQQVAAPVGRDKWLSHVRKWMKGTLEGIAFMSSLEPPLMHLDMKLNNVVATDADVAKIIDFGFTVPYTEFHKALVTLRFTPPEHMVASLQNKKKEYAKDKAWAYDVWTMGSIYYNLLCSEPDGNTLDAAMDAAEAILEGKPTAGKLPQKCKDGTLGYGEAEDWAVVTGALAILEERQSPEALLDKLPA